MEKDSNLRRLNIDEVSEEEREFIRVLDSRIIGQAAGKAAAARAVRRAWNPLRNSRGPIYKLLQIGESRTGKTLTAETAALALHGDATALIAVDCGNYKQPHQVHQIIGAPPGYLGYKDPGGQKNEKNAGNSIDPSALFTRANLVASRKGSKCPITVILLDEIEKACNEFFDFLLALFDKGKTNLANNVETDFSDCLFFMTSNLGMEKVEQLFRRIGFSDQPKVVATEQDIASVARKELRLRFKPEFLKRIDEVVIFTSLSAEQVKQVLELEISLLKKRIAEQLKDKQCFSLEVKESACAFILAQAEKDGGGVAEIKHILDRYIADVLGRELQKGSIGGGDRVVVSHQPGENKLTFEVEVMDAPDVPAAALAKPAEPAVPAKPAETTAPAEPPVQADRLTLSQLRSLAANGISFTGAGRSFKTDQESVLPSSAKWTNVKLVNEVGLDTWLSHYLEPAAVTFVMNHWVNAYWFWVLLQMGCGNASALPIKVAHLQQAKGTLRKQFGTIGSNYKDVLTFGRLVSHGMLVYGLNEEDEQGIFINRLFL